MFLEKSEINRILAKYYDPRNPVSRLFYKNPEQCTRIDFAIVENNQDPDKKGRLKLHFPLLGDNVVSGWVPFARPYAGSGGGFWALPEVGDTVICFFLNDNPSKPVVIGCMYTPKTPPPIKTNSGNNLKLLTTRSGSRILFDDTDGEEKLMIHTKDGEMRLVLDKTKGISIVNSKGEIKIKCRKLIIQGGDAAEISMEKELKIKCDGDVLKLETGKGLSFKSGKDLVVKGSKIKIKGSSGVTAGVKQIAKQDDQVIGVDFHDIMVPSQSGLIKIPMIPHPYLGKLADKLSDDVTINDKAAAVKGSKSKYSTPGHFPMPPGVKFAANPNNEGEVSSGTEPSVKINGKEAAVLGSMVKTCNDPQPQETCTIVAIGVAVPLPIFIPGMDKDTFEKDGGTVFNTRDPIAPPGGPLPQEIQRSLNNPKWEKNKAGTGENVKLSVSLTNQYENAGVHFAVWPEGADTQNDAPLAKLQAPNKGGTAEAFWRYNTADFVFDNPPSALMDYLNEKLGLDIDSSMAKYFIDNYEDPYNNPVKDKAKFFFTAKSFRCEEVKSDAIEVGDKASIVFKDQYGQPIKDVKYTLIGPDGTKTEGTTGKDGTIDEEALIPGKHQIKFEYPEE